MGSYVRPEPEQQRKPHPLAAIGRFLMGAIRVGRRPGQGLQTDVRERQRERRGVHGEIEAEFQRQNPRPREAREKRNYHSQPGTDW